ncbi:VCBS repeat-containing protein, partial [Dolichospermum sp. ST_sed3]|nr:VCBS repeat-containing protein [Dolichospermum sp. ST_sed3]
IDNNGSLDIFYSGDFSGSNSRTNKTYINSNGTFNLWEGYNFDYAKDVSVNLFCYINNSLYLISSGVSDASKLTQVYKVDINSSINIQNLTGFANPTANCFDFDNDNTLELFISGTNTTGKVSLVYEVSDGLFVYNQTLNTIYDLGSSAVGDINNDGYGDIIYSGTDASFVPVLFGYLYDSSNHKFTYLNLSNTTMLGYLSAVALFDFDIDGDLDFFVTGCNAAFATKAFIYKSNYNLQKNNTIPNVSNTLQVNYTINGLEINWTPGNDAEQGQNGLYYNLRVGTIPGANDIVSGKYGGSSNPVAGYIGNMQQRRNITLNVSNTTYFVQVQTIDSGLRNGSWSRIYSNNGSCPDDTCAASTCSNTTCADTCGNVFNGTLDCVYPVFTQDPVNMSVNDTGMVIQ